MLSELVSSSFLHRGQCCEFLPVDGSGFEVLEWLAHRKRVAEIPVIVLTASSNPEDAKRAYSLGARHYMRKSADFGKLVTAMKEVLDRWIKLDLESSKCG